LDLPRNLILIAAGEKVAFLDVLTLESVKPPLLHPGAVISLTMSDDRARVVTACFDERVRVWDVESGAIVAEKKLEYFPVDTISSPDGKSIMVGIASAVRQLDLETLTPVSPDLVHPENVDGIAFHPDGHSIATACENRNAYIWMLGSESKAP